ncbi:MAG: PIN domain-containing protein [Thermomicrobiales bacterium]
MEGLLDTNVFIHAQTNDEHSDECRAFLLAIQHNEIVARLEPVVLHELTYALRHYRRQMTRSQIGEYLLVVLSWPGIRGDRDLMTDAVYRWIDTPGLGLVDAYLSAMADRDNCPVYTINARDFEHQSIDVPQPLPSYR